MIIDLEKTILLKTKGKFIALILLVVIICALLFIPFRINLIKGLDNTVLAIFFAVAYVLYSFYESFRNYNYIYFNNDSDRLILRFFSTGVFTKTKNSIEIPKKEFAGYKLNSFFMRYRESIVLFRKTSKGVAKYPSVSITALSNDQRSSLLDALDRLRAENDKNQ
jgi:hypothetical protein